MSESMSETAGTSPTRRTVVPGVVVTVVAGVAGYVVADQNDSGGSTGASSSGGTAGTATEAGGGGGGAVALAKEAQVTADGGVILAGANIVLTRNAAGAVQGFSAVCTHQGCTVNTVSDGKIRCPCHGSAFDARTGQPVAGPAKTPLPPVAVTVRNGEVFRA
jgi:Rieske Fe-S protein